MLFQKLLLFSNMLVKNDLRKRKATMSFSVSVVYGADLFGKSCCEVLFSKLEKKITSHLSFKGTGRSWRISLLKIMNLAVGSDSFG